MRRRPTNTPKNPTIPSHPHPQHNRNHKKQKSTSTQHMDNRLHKRQATHTGYSLSASDDARKKMLSVDGDVDALAEAVRAWLARNKRWNSPVYLAGESYGTTRGAALADKLHELGVALSGLILVSCAMDLQ